MDSRNDVIDKLRTATFWIGAVLVAAGTVSLLYLAMVVVQVINEPEGTLLVQWLVAKVSESEMFLSGHLGEVQFEIKASSALQYISLGIIGLVLVSILSAVVRGFIQSGIQLIKFAGTKIQADDAQAGKHY
jgi:hypothetical protein